MKVKLIELDDERRDAFGAALAEFVGKSASKHVDENQEKLKAIAESIFTDEERDALLKHADGTGDSIVLVRNLPLPTIMPDTPNYYNQLNVDDSYVMDYAMHAIAYMMNIHPNSLGNIVCHHSKDYFTAQKLHQDMYYGKPAEHSMIGIMKGHPRAHTSFIKAGSIAKMIAVATSLKISFLGLVDGLSTTSLTPLAPLRPLFRRLTTNILSEAGDMILWDNRKLYHGLLKNVLNYGKNEDKRWIKHVMCSREPNIYSRHDGRLV